MLGNDYLSTPDAHLDPVVAAVYDRSLGDEFRPESIQRAVSLLAELAGEGPAVEC